MKILHSADLHLGKRLEGKSRLAEQAEALNELKEIVEKEKIDVVLMAGDIFDTFVPSAEAEQLFYSMCLKINAIIVCISGNHDDAERLKAPSGIAGASKIYLVGGLDNTHLSDETVTGGQGYLKIKIKGETLNLVCLPFPSAARLLKEGINIIDKPFENAVKELLLSLSDCFKTGDINMIVSHLYIANCESGDETELGTAAKLPKSIIPKCHYTALGHIHKNQTVSKSNNVFYSGSILQYSFDETSEKFFNIVECDGQNFKLLKAPIKAGKKLVTVRAENFIEADKLLKENVGAYVHLIFAGAPLDRLKMKELKTNENLTKFTNVFKSQLSHSEYRERSDRQLFMDYYESKYGAPASNELIDMFLTALTEEGRR